MDIDEAYNTILNSIKSGSQQKDIISNLHDKLVKNISNNNFTNLTELLNMLEPLYYFHDYSQHSKIDKIKFDIKYIRNIIEYDISENVNLLENSTLIENIYKLLDLPSFLKKEDLLYILEPFFNKFISSRYTYTFNYKDKKSLDDKIEFIINKFIKLYSYNDFYYRKLKDITYNLSKNFELDTTINILYNIFYKYSLNNNNELEYLKYLIEHNIDNNNTMLEIIDNIFRRHNFFNLIKCTKNKTVYTILDYLNNKILEDKEYYRIFVENIFNNIYSTERDNIDQYKYNDLKNLIGILIDIIDIKKENINKIKDYIENNNNEPAFVELNLFLENNNIDKTCLKQFLKFHKNIREPVSEKELNKLIDDKEYYNKLKIYKNNNNYTIFKNFSLQDYYIKNILTTKIIFNKVDKIIKNTGNVEPTF